MPTPSTSRIPLDSAGHVQHVVQRAKIEYNFALFLKLGLGYGANKPIVGPWRQKPFATMTVRGGRGGDVELWLQRLPNHEATLQICTPVVPVDIRPQQSPTALAETQQIGLFAPRQPDVKTILIIGSRP